MTKKKKIIKDTKEVQKVILSHAQEEYLDIYHKYFVLRWDWTDIAKYHKCTKQKVQCAITWVVDNKLKFPSKELIKGAVDAISARLKNKRALDNTEVIKKRFRDNIFIIALSKEIREDEKILGDLENIHDKSDGGEQQSLSASQVLQLIAAAKKSK